MHRLISLFALLLVACAAPAERVEKPGTMTVTADENTYLIRSAYDAGTFSWTARVWSMGEPLTEKDRETARTLVRLHLAPKLCVGGGLEFKDGDTWNKLSGAHERFNSSIGEWRFAGVCA